MPSGRRYLGVLLDPPLLKQQNSRLLKFGRCEFGCFLGRAALSGWQKCGTSRQESHKEGGAGAQAREEQPLLAGEVSEPGLLVGSALSLARSESGFTDLDLALEVRPGSASASASLPDRLFCPGLSLLCS